MKTTAPDSLLIRPRRLRGTALLRDLVAETHLQPNQLIAPLFVKEGLIQDSPVSSMPGVFQHALKNVGCVARDWYKRGVRSLLLFGIPQKNLKDAVGSQSQNPQGIVPRAIQEIKSAVPEMCVIADVCLCEYTSHGHCGLVDAKTLRIENDATLPHLAQTAVSVAQAGADIIAPSDMMDGRVQAIRRALDAGGFTDTPLMSYAVKYASALYGPFRDAAENTPAVGDRSSYQMDPRNAREALREANLDESEGADFLIVKPAGFYLDVIQRVSDESLLPVIGYQVSGEYSMLTAAISQGWLNEKRVIQESLLAIRRAGARMIISYFTPAVVQWL